MHNVIDKNTYLGMDIDGGSMMMMIKLEKKAKKKKKDGKGKEKRRRENGEKSLCQGNDRPLKPTALICLVAKKRKAVMMFC